MKNNKLLLAATAASLAGLWLLAEPLPALELIAVRNALLQVTGIFAIGAMSLAMVLAARPKVADTRLGGLDKAYRLHKWLGIGGLAAGVLHWLAVQTPKWLSSLGLIARRKRGPRPPQELLGAVEQFFRDQRHTAEQVGEICFYAAVVLIALALIKRFPYRLFAKTHWLLVFPYLALVFHAVILARRAYWTQPIGIVLALMLLAGTLSALSVLRELRWPRGKTAATITSLTHHPGADVLETRLRVDESWKGHRPGQFAFVTFHPEEGHHPFTITSAWDPSTTELVFMSKALGDYTCALPQRLKEGDRAVIEGPYGRFTFDEGERQIWVGGGIGITAFLARLEELAKTPHHQSIDLLHSANDIDEEARQRLQRAADAANVRLHLVLTGQDADRLNGQRLRDTIPDWEGASFWFCGPTAFGQSLKRDLVAAGLPTGRFHQELFEMR